MQAENIFLMQGASLTPSSSNLTYQTGTYILTHTLTLLHINPMAPKLMVQILTQPWYKYSPSHSLTNTYITYYYTNTCTVYHPHL